MHLAKWIRKNSTKIMVFVVIFSMVSFVIGYTGLQIFFSFFSNQGNVVVATYGKGQKLRARDFLTAQSELQLLRVLAGPQILASQPQLGPAGYLLAYLLFPDDPTFASLPAQLQRAAKEGQLPVSQQVVKAFFEHRLSADEAWLLLKREAQLAGCVFPRANAQNLLAQIAKQINSDNPGVVIQNLMAQFHMTEQQMANALAELLTVAFYVSSVLDNQPLTLNEVQALVATRQQKLTAALARIPATWFVQKDQPVEDADLQKQFEAYKEVLAGQVSAENPYGFGYQLPARVQLEYMVVRIDDIRARIEQPTQEQMEEYYSRNRQQFEYQEPADPAKPDGERITKVRSFADALPQIRRSLEEERITRLGNQWFNQAKAELEKGFGGLHMDSATFEQLQAAAGDYEQVAAQVGQTLQIPAVVGKTGYLSATDFATDPMLQTMRIIQGQNVMMLSELALNVVMDPKHAPRFAGMLRVRPWENIGPMNTGFFDEAARQFVRLMVMVRVVDFKPQQTPSSIDVVYPRHAIQLTPQTLTEQAKGYFSLKDQIAADVRLLRAMETAQQKAQQLAQMIAADGWDKALETFNQQLKEQAIDGTVNIMNLDSQPMMTAMEQAMIQAAIAGGSPSAMYLKERLNENALRQKLFGLLTDQTSELTESAKVVVCEPMQAAYVVRSVKLFPATEKDWLEHKTTTAFQAARMAEIEAALIFLNPNYIQQRMNYHRKEREITAPQQIELPDEGV